MNNYEDNEEEELIDLDTILEYMKSDNCYVAEEAKLYYYEIYADDHERLVMDIIDALETVMNHMIYIIIIGTILAMILMSLYT
jgi:hypothetical protein